MSGTELTPDPDALRVHFGLELRRLRLQAGLSMKQLADALGCTPQWVCQLEGADKAVPEQSALDLDTYFKTMMGEALSQADSIEFMSQARETYL
jgi:transcriptional regulator with XRE-family HTH domain